MHALGAQMLPSYARIDEAMRRYRETEHVDPVFERLLGIEVKREQYRLGRGFCDTVVELTDEATLARMWDSAEALPSMPELEEPRLWLARSETGPKRGRTARATRERAGVGYPLAAMTVGELVSANVVDQRPGTPTANRVPPASTCSARPARRFPSSSPARGRSGRAW